MTSSQPVATPNALNFTPDNKHCYAYSGVVTLSTSYQTLLEFTTQSEYVKAILQLMADLDDLSTSWLDYELKFNDVIVAHAQMERNNFDWEPLDIIIPPFTEVKFNAKVQATTPKATAVLIGEAFGMTDVGYQ